jgi:hypothetical protein
MDYGAKVIADSVSTQGHRLTTVEATYPRFVHSELMTHRRFSRNAASSRAIPVAKSITRAQDTPAYPVHWGAEKPEMQPGDALEGEDLRKAKGIWGLARGDGARHAQRLTEIGLHKSLVNRIIEPWSWITTIITATEWVNFFAQRATSHTELAQPELARIADMIEAVIKGSKPTTMVEGDWHLPYIDAQDWATAKRLTKKPTDATDMLRKVSVARCARVSLLNHDGTRELPADVGLYDKLVSATPMHASPLEHVATPDQTNVHLVAVWDRRVKPAKKVGEHPEPLLGNLLGWAQLRHMVEETRSA